MSFQRGRAPIRSPETDSGSASSVASESLGGQEHAPDLAFGTLPAEGSATPTLDAVAAESDAGDGDDGDVTLDEILGEGTHAHVESLLDGVSSRCLSATMALAAAQERGMSVDDFVAHCDGAWLLAEALERTAGNLEATATWDASGDGIEFDAGYEEATLDLVERVEVALPILDDILVLANQDTVQVLADMIDAWATMGADWVARIAIRAETGIRMTERLVASFKEHQAAYEKHLAFAKMDVATLLVGPLLLAGDSLESMRRLWTMTRAFGAIGTDPSNAWDTARTARSFGSAMAGEATRKLGRENPWRTAWPGVSTLLTTCQTIIDLGLATTDLALMQQDLRLAQEVQREYGDAIEFFTQNEESLESFASVLVRLVGISERVGGALESVEARVAAAGPDLYVVSY